MRQSPSARPRRTRAIVIGCWALAITGCGASTSTTTGNSATFAAALRFARCMRAHGVPGFRDPTPTGATLPAGGVDKRSPAFRAAQRACATQARRLAAAKPARSRATQLRFAECMRARGVSRFPDPLPGGGFTVPATIDSRSPAFIAAQRACERAPPG